MLEHSNVQYMPLFKVGLITSSHASCPGKMRSSGPTVKQPKGLFWLLTGMDCGRFAVSASNQREMLGVPYLALNWNLMDQALKLFPER